MMSLQEDHEEFTEHLSYWKQQLRDIPALLHLPIARPRPVVSNYHRATMRFPLPRNLVEDLKILSEREHVTLFVTLLAAFQTLLARYSGQDDIVVGSLAAQCAEETGERMGSFANSVVLRTRLSGNIRFRDL